MTKLGWVIYHSKQASLSQCTEYDEVLYVLSVGDLVDIYEEDRPGGWVLLAPQKRVALVMAVAEALQNWPGGDHDFADVFREVIEKTGTPPAAGSVQ